MVKLISSPTLRATTQVELEIGRTTSRKLWIQAQGYPAYSQRFCTHAEETLVILDAVLDPERMVSVSGRLITADGKPVKAAPIWGNSLPEPLPTDERGYFRYDGFDAANWRFLFHTKPSGYLLKEINFTIDIPRHFDLGEIVLEKGKTIFGTCDKPTGRTDWQCCRPCKRISRDWTHC